MLALFAGLDEAILGSMNAENPEQNSEHIADLLKNGAHKQIAKQEAKVKEGEAFANEDITEILAQRTEKRQIGSRAGNTFSTAQFAADELQVCPLLQAILRRRNGRFCLSSKLRLNGSGDLVHQHWQTQRGL